MDPYLEGELWPDVHHSLATKIRNMLAPRLRPKYVARIELYTVKDEYPEEEVGIMYPDVEVFRTRQAPETAPKRASREATPANLTLTEPMPVTVRIPSIEIRTVSGLELVTAIEILSPVNKGKSGFEAYQRKRKALKEAEVHLLEIDLLRRGKRIFQHPGLPESDYLICLTRAGQAQTDVWTIDVRDRLPILPIPLLEPDPDLTVSLGKALREIYDEAFYNSTIDYSLPPPPPVLAEEKAEWARQLLSENRED